jgi:uncharacterized membrane protein YcjF (UPF0283 family)
LTDLILGQESAAVQQFVVALEPLTDALVAKRANAVQIRLLRGIAKLYGGDWAGISRVRLCQIADGTNTSVEIAVTKSIADGFLEMDSTTRPRRFRIHPTYSRRAGRSA